MDFWENGEGQAGTLILAHGAGAGADHPFLETFASGLAARGFRVIRFEFPYMKKRRKDSRKRPPDRTEILLTSYEELLDSVGCCPAPLIIGGKSMGGRIASMLVTQPAPTKVDGLVCLGYPFHPPGKPERLRTDHFPDIAVPTLIVQGERDPFGGRDLVANLKLPATIKLHWVPDGNHDLAPRKTSGHTTRGNHQAAMNAIAAFARTL